MSYEKDLTLSPKFSYFLNQTGQLDALVIAYQTFREQQNYPFELKEKRIAVQAVFKGLCELYASRGFDEKKLITSDKILEEAKEIVKKFWDLKEETWEKRPEKESTKMVEKKIKVEKEKIDKNKKLFVLDIKGGGKAKDFHATCATDSKENAYEILVEKFPALKKQKKETVIKTIKEEK